MPDQWPLYAWYMCLNLLAFNTLPELRNSLKHINWTLFASQKLIFRFYVRCLIILFVILLFLADAILISNPVVVISHMVYNKYNLFFKIQQKKISGYGLKCHLYSISDLNENCMWVVEFYTWLVPITLKVLDITAILPSSMLSIFQEFQRDSRLILYVTDA